jgi:HEAT repeat protein
MKDGEAAEAVRSICLNDPNPYVRPEAIGALARLEGEGAVATLQALVNDTNALVRRAASAELDQLRRGLAEGVLLGRLTTGAAGPADWEPPAADARF